MEELKLFIQEEIQNIAFTKVEFDESLVKSGILDSITVVDLAVSIEQRTGKQIPFADVIEENFETINFIEEYVKMNSDSST